MSLNQLGVLYGKCLHRREEAVTFFRQAAFIYLELGDLKNEGLTRINISSNLFNLQRYDEARTEIERAIECLQPIWPRSPTLDILRHPAPHRNRNGQPSRRPRRLEAS